MALEELFLTWFSATQVVGQPISEFILTLHQPVCKVCMTLIPEIYKNTFIIFYFKYPRLILEQT
jgi:hypothetical protein